MVPRVVCPVLFLILGGLVSQSAAQWDVQSFGKGDLTNPFDVKVADARGDGVQRVYVSERDGNVTEWTFLHDRWSKTLVAEGVRGLAMLAIGDARGDGIRRVYFTEFNEEGKLYEAQWRDAAWDVAVIGEPHQSLCLFMGPGRGDGETRLYVGNSGGPSGTGGGLWEYSFARGRWTGIQITTSKGMQGAGVVADLHNDGESRVLAHGSVLDELIFHGKTYASSPIDHSDRLWPAPTGADDIRNDGRVRVFINGGQGRAEYVYGSGGWTKYVIDPTARRGDLVAARLRSDGLQRLYATESEKKWGDRLPKGPLREFTWDADSQAYRAQIVVDAITGATAKIATGSGRNDAVMRLYAPDHEGGRILEITSDDPLLQAE